MRGKLKRNVAEEGQIKKNRKGVIRTKWKDIIKTTG